MSKSNGRRPVNKTDGPKKRGKRALTKSRRNDKKKIIEEEMNEMKIKVITDLHEKLAAAEAEVARLKQGWDDTETALYAWMEKLKGLNVEHGKVNTLLDRALVICARGCSCDPYGKRVCGVCKALEAIQAERKGIT